MAEDATEVEEEAANKKSLQEYLEEMKNNNLNATPAAKTVENFEGVALKAKDTEVYAEATKVKKVKSKQLKTKQFLDFDVTFSDSLPKARSDRNTRGGNRGGNRGGKKPSQRSEQSKGPAVTNFPSLA